MIDTHAHIRKDEELKMEGLDWVVLSASDLEDSLENIKLAIGNKKLLAAVGVHPQAVPENIDKTINLLDELLTDNEEIVAVGECGLDFSAETSDRLKQEILFRGQIALALKHDKPLIVHSRKAADETIKVLSSYKKMRGVIHCYSGGKKRIKNVLELGNGWYFGIDGNLTYEDGLQEVVAQIPPDRLVLETDSPELTPIPFKGEKNYPEYVKFIYQKVAEIWGKSLEETEEMIDNNARKLFSVKK